MRNALRHTLAVLLIVLLLPAQPAQAWLSPGHMAVAFIAYQQLTPSTRKRVKTLLKLNPKFKDWLAFIPPGTSQADIDLFTFMMAATWPDEIKAAGSGFHPDGPNNGDTPPTDMAEATRNLGYVLDKDLHKYWHFIDTPISPDNTGTAAVTPNAETQIDAFRTALASKESKSLKSYDLVWIEHLVGDIHQPLHASTRFIAGRSDNGGNGVVLIGNPTELHAFWDGLPGKGLTKDFRVAVAFATPLLPAPSTLADDTDVAHWAAESFALAQSDAYTNPPIDDTTGPFTLTDSYRATALADAKLRVALAGARLAKLLNENLK